MRAKKIKKPIYYVCSAILNQKLLSLQVEAKSMTEASSIFRIQNNIDPQTIYGPFFAKRKGSFDRERNLKFNGKSMKAIYNGWKVSALLLSEPVNCALLFFEEKIDGAKTAKPTGTFVVNIETLQGN